MRARLAPSRLLALLFVLALGALPLAALLAQSARVPLRTPLVPRAARVAPVAVPLEGREGRQGTAVFRLELLAHDPAALVSHEELQLFFEGDASRATLVSSRLELRKTGCALVAEPLDELTSRQAVVFRRGTGCPGLARPSGPVALDLAVETRGAGSVALLAFEAPEEAEPLPITVAAAPLRPRPLAVRGAFVDYPATASRLTLLNHMWRIAPGTGWLLGLVGLAIALASAGCLLFPTRPSAGVDAAPRRTMVGQAGAGASLLAASLALLHTALAPPLSGPDEPYHLLGFAALVKDDALARDTVAWMGETHLWRIRQQPSERFRTIDVGQPYVVEDDQLRPTEVAMRSAILARLWRVAAPLAAGGSAPRALFRLRLVNVVVFAFAVGVAASLAMLLAGAAYPQWLVFPFLFVPSLPFFSMHVSETAVLCAVYVVLAASVALLCLDGPQAHWAGAPLGLATGLMLAGGRSPWPLAALVAAVLVGRVALASRSSPRPARDALVFWSGFGLGASVLFALVDEPYRLMTGSYVLVFARFLPESLREMAHRLLIDPASGTAILLLGAAGGAAVELAAARPRDWLAARLGPLAQGAVPRVAAAAAAAVVLSLLGSLFLRYPQLPTETTYFMPVGERLAAALATMVTMFRLTEPNFLLASSFWVGFGWLDTLPGPRFQGLLIALAAVALVLLLLQLGREREVRRVAWLAAVAVGAVVSLVLYTAWTQDRTSTLVGRHLVGWYLVVLAVIGTGLTFDRWTSGGGGGESGGAAPGAGRAALLLVVAGGVHVYCLWFVLQRYF